MTSSNCYRKARPNLSDRKYHQVYYLYSPQILPRLLYWYTLLIRESDHSSHKHIKTVLVLVVEERFFGSITRYGVVKEAIQQTPFLCMPLFLHFIRYPWSTPIECTILCVRHAMARHFASIDRFLREPVCYVDTGTIVGAAAARST